MDNICLRFKACQININNCLQDVIGVIIGGVLGHAICTGIAVLGGRIVAQKISVRTGKYKFTSACDILSIIDIHVSYAIK